MTSDGLPEVVDKESTPTETEIEAVQPEPELFEWKDNRLRVFEKPISLDKHPLCIKSSFDLENSAAIGSEHFLLISLLIQEKYFLLTVRESQESTLISKLLRILFPDTYETRDPESEEIKSKKFQLVQTAIREIATRVNYGLSQTKQPLSHFCWRWEVTDLSQFPNHLMQLVVERRNKRKIMQDFLSGLFDSLTEDQRQELKRKRAPEKKNTEPKLKKEKKTEEPKKEKKVNEKPKKAEKPKLNPNQQVMSNFVKIIKKDPSEDPVKEERTYFESLFPPFFVKENVSVAPINQFYHTQESMELEGDPIDFKTHSWVNRKFDNRCDKPKDSCMKMHLLQFHTNQRPAYFGTLNTRNYKIKARNPFKQDPEIDYENDSDDEWEDVEDGESISSGGEEEEEEDLEDESENDWLVPHGYLSDDEVSDIEKAKSEKKTLQKKKIHEFQPAAYFYTQENFEIVPLGSFVLSLESYHPTIKPVNHKTKKKTELSKEQMESLKTLVDNRVEGLGKLHAEFKEKGFDVSRRMFEQSVAKVAVREKRGNETRATYHLRSPENK